MNRLNFYEALYTSCSYIVARRKSIALPILVILIGIALPLLSMMILDGPRFDDLNSTIILIAIALAVGGAIWLLSRATGKGEPFHSKRGEFLTTSVLSFDRSRRSEVLNAIGSGDVERLFAIPVCNVSALCVMVTTLPDKSFVAAQPFEYAELEYRELSPVQVMKE